MARGRVHVFRMAGGGAVTATVIRRAQMRAAFDDLARYLGRRLAWVVTSFRRAAARVFRDAAWLWRIGLVLGRPPISGPLPDVADHVVNAVAVRRKRRHRRGTIEPVLAAIFVREISLPGIRHMSPAGREFFTPGELGAIKTTPGGIFPFGLGR